MSTDYKLVCFTCKSVMPEAFASSSISYGYKVWDFAEETHKWLGHRLPIGLHEGHDLRIVKEQTELPWLDSDGDTQFGRVLYELNIESICANSSQAKGRVERANLTLQDRLVKELRLQGISTMAEANAFVPLFIKDFNRRFAKPPRNDFDAHRALRHDENMDSIFTVREPRRLTRSLTLRYDKKLYLIADTQEARSAIGKYIEVYEYPDGRIEVWANGGSLSSVTYDKLPDINQGEVVENKRLGHVLQVAQLMQEQRDSRRGLGTAARTNQGKPKPPKKAAPGTKSPLMLNTEDLSSAIEKAGSKREKTGTLG